MLRFNQLITEVQKYNIGIIIVERLALHNTSLLIKK